MKLKTMVFIALLAAAHSASAQDYCNARFHYCVSYPSTLQAEPEADNGDGRRFSLPGSEAEILVFGSHEEGAAKPGRFIQSLKAQYRSHHPAYEKAEGGSYVVSYREGGTIVYKRYLVLTGKQKGSVAQLSFSYPAAEQAQMKAVIGQMSNSLRQVH